MPFNLVNPDALVPSSICRAMEAGSSVLGTFHADSAEAVYKRAVEDLGVSKVSFTATDLVVVAGLVQPKGKKERFRRVVQIAELIKDGPPGRFRDLFVFDRTSGKLEPTEFLESSSSLKAIAKLWGIPPIEIINEIRIRSSILEEAGRVLGPERITRPDSMLLVNEAYQIVREEALEKGRFKNWKTVFKRWKREMEREEP